MNWLKRRGFNFFSFYSIVDMISDYLLLRKGKKREHEVTHTWFCDKWDRRADRSIAVRIFGLNFKIIPAIGRKHFLKKNLV